MASSPRYTVLIDGYNVIKRHAPWSTLPLREARQRLVGQLQLTHWPLPIERTIVVFDTREPDPSMTYPSDRLQVCFASPSADAFMQQAIRASKTPQHVLVVTDDAEILSTAKSHGALRHSTSWLTQQLLLAVKNIRPGRVSPEEPQDKPGQSSAAARRITDELERRWLGPSSP